MVESLFLKDEASTEIVQHQARRLPGACVVPCSSRGAFDRAGESCEGGGGGAFNRWASPIMHHLRMALGSFLSAPACALGGDAQADVGGGCLLGYILVPLLDLLASRRQSRLSAFSALMRCRYF